MTVEVVTVWAPRREHPKWRDDYIDMLRLQAKTAARFVHRHTVVTDDPHCDVETAMVTALPASLMRAMIAGVVARLSAPVDCDLVFIDADVIVARDLSEAFDGSFDLGLTRRNNVVSPINNGAMYVAKEGADEAEVFFRHALARCGDHWGADQEAISAVAAPVPDYECVEQRGDMRLAFLSMRTHNVSPKLPGLHHRANPFCVHFKGETKAWAQEYVDKFVL